MPLKRAAKKLRMGERRVFLQRFLAADANAAREQYWRHARGSAEVCDPSEDKVCR